MSAMTGRSRQRGSAMLVTMILITSLLAGAAVLVSMQIASNRSSDISRTSMSSLHCAEAGLSAARPLVAANYSSWPAALASSPAEPAFLTSGLGAHDIDGDSVADFTVYLKDNDDELPPATLDPAADNDLRVFIVSRCTKYPDTPKEVAELVQYSGGGTCYQSQQGGCNENNNNN